jgi:hypothetical protein
MSCLPGPSLAWLTQPLKACYWNAGFTHASCSYGPDLTKTVGGEIVVDACAQSPLFYFILFFSKKKKIYLNPAHESPGIFRGI